MKITKSKLEQIIKEEIKKSDLTKVKKDLKQDVDDAIEHLEHQ